MTTKFKPTRILGHVINTSPSAMDARESSPQGYIPEDMNLLTSLRVLQKNKANLGSEEEIRQFFRWAAAEEKYPLPPLVRKILCMNRAKLVDAMDSMKTTDPQRTYEKNAITEIDRFLREDGVTNPETKEVCEKTDKKGSWLKGGVAPITPTPSGSCDIKPIMDKLDEVKMYQKTNFDELKTAMENCCTSKPESQEDKKRIAELEQQLTDTKAEMDKVAKLLEQTQIDATKLAELQTQLAESQGQNQNLQRQLEEAQVQSQNIQQQQLQAAQAQARQVDDLQQQLQAAQAQARQVDDLQQQQLQAAQAQARQVDDLQQQLKDAQEEARQVNDLQQQLQAAQAQARQVDDLQQQLKDAQEEAKIEKTNNARYQTLADTIRVYGGGKSVEYLTDLIKNKNLFGVWQELAKANEELAKLRSDLEKLRASKRQQGGTRKHPKKSDSKNRKTYRK